MNNFKKIINRHTFSLFIVFFMFSLVAAGAATAAKYQDQMPDGVIVWDHQDVSGWAITSDLHKVDISGGQINMLHTQACNWPLVDSAVNANSWVIRKKNNIWRASTWDFMRRCQTTKGYHDVGADDGWRPRDGEEIYIFISGIARPGYAHLDSKSPNERTNIIRYYWNRAPATATPLSTCSEKPFIIDFKSNASLINVGQPVTLSWDIVEADSIEIVTDTDRKIEVSEQEIKHGSITFSVENDNEVYTLTATNGCGVTPSQKITVKVNKGLPGLPVLLLNR